MIRLALATSLLASSVIRGKIWAIVSSEAFVLVHIAGQTTRNIHVVELRLRVICDFSARIQSTETDLR